MSREDIDSRHFVFQLIDDYVGVEPSPTEKQRKWREVTRYRLAALFNNMRTLKFKAQLTNAFFATVNQMFGGSFQLPAIAERAVIKSLSTVQTTKQCSAVVGSWEEPPNIWLTVAKNTFVGWALNFRVCMLLKSAVSVYRFKRLLLLFFLLNPLITNYAYRRSLWWCSWYHLWRHQFKYYQMFLMSN